MTALVDAPADFHWNVITCGDIYPLADVLLDPVYGVERVATITHHTLDTGVTVVHMCVTRSAPGEDSMRNVVRGTHEQVLVRPFIEEAS